MPIDRTPWPATTGPEAQAFQQACQAIVRLLIAVPPEFFVQRLADPRFIHRALYETVLPSERVHLAGAYRGSMHPDLKTYTVAFAFSETEGTSNLAPPQEVAALMRQYGDKLARSLNITANHPVDAVRSVTEIITFLGYIHPFWDGNGHIQRITFESLLRHHGIKTNPRWSIHPCPYGVETNRAFASMDNKRVSDLMLEFVEL